MMVFPKAAALWLSMLARTTAHAQPEAAKSPAPWFDPIARVVMHPRCVNCHEAINSANGQVPGAKHGHLAPASMNWQGMKAGEICRQMKDPARNGNRRTGAQVIDHMATDPLVLWAWTPGTGRSQPPVSHADFLTGLRAWADQGMPCPL